VIADLDERPPQFRWRVICGLTGSGKSRLLRALARHESQVLDLEALAAPSRLGAWRPARRAATFAKNVRKPGMGSAAQIRCGAARVVEAESKKIGSVRVPEALIASMWNGECIRLEASVACASPC